MLASAWSWQRLADMGELRHDTMDAVASQPSTSSKKKRNDHMPSVGVFAAIFDDERRILCVKMNYGQRVGRRRVESSTRTNRLSKRSSAKLSKKRTARSSRKNLSAFTPNHQETICFCSSKQSLSNRANGSPMTRFQRLDFSAGTIAHPMDALNLTRIQDAFEGRSGIVRVLDPEMESE